jgi:hypothetical protein
MEVVRIYVDVVFPDGNMPLRVAYAFGADQIEKLRLGPEPHRLDSNARLLWERNRALAESFSNYIARELSDAILVAFNPELKGV